MRKEIKRNFIKNLKIQLIKIQRKWDLEKKKKKPYLIIKIREIIKGKKKGAKAKPHPHWY
jgi:hypothetical protein